MDTEEILSRLKDIMEIIGAGLGKFGLFLWEQLGRFFAWAAEAVSEYFSAITLPMMPTILKVFSNKSVNRAVFYILLCYIILINIAAFMMYGADKRRAESRRERRISESSLLKICFWGGALGGLVGMQTFRHKTLKRKFKLLVPIMFVFQLLFGSFIIGFLAFWAFF